MCQMLMPWTEKGPAAQGLKLRQAFLLCAEMGLPSPDLRGALFPFLRKDTPFHPGLTWGLACPKLRAEVPGSSCHDIRSSSPVVRA